MYVCVCERVCACMCECECVCACMCECECVCVCVAVHKPWHTCGGQRIVCGVSSPLPPCRLQEDWTQFVRPGGKCLSMLLHLYSISYIIIIIHLKTNHFWFWFIESSGWKGPRPVIPSKPHLHTRAASTRKVLSQSRRICKRRFTAWVPPQPYWFDCKVLI